MGNPNSMSTFAFDTDSPPVEGEAVVGLFKTGFDMVVSNILVPNAEPGASCTADINGDCVVDGQDLAQILANWNSAGGDLTGDGTTNGQDLSTVLANWECDCN